MSRPIIGTVLALALIAGFSLGSSDLAGASSTNYVAAANGMVGVPQVISIMAPQAAGQTVSVGLQAGPNAFTRQAVLNSAGEGAVSWTPTAVGIWTISGLGAIVGAGSSVATVAPMPTYTLLLAQNHVQRDASNSLLGIVVAPIGVLAPTGTLTLSSSTGNKISSKTLTTTTSTSTTSSLVGVATATASANLSWTPLSDGDLPILASYAPASGGQLASVTPVSHPDSNTGIATVSVRWPADLYAGAPTVLQAVLGAGIPEGSVAFIDESGSLAGSSPTVNGVASALVTFSASGVHTITAQYTGTNPGYSGSSTQSVFIKESRGLDQLSVAPTGQAAWSVAQPLVMASGSSVTLSGTSASGTTVLLSAQGACVISGDVLTTLAPGVCLVTAVSPGNSSILPGNSTYTIAVQAAETRSTPAKR